MKRHTAGNPPHPSSPDDTPAAAPAGAETGDVIEELGEAVLDQDYTTSIVPDSKRRGQTKMAILWATLNAALVVMTIGFLARSQGLSLKELWLAGFIAVGIAFVYGFGAANLGAYTGQTLTLLARTIFGQAGSVIVSLLLIMIGLGWYCFQAFFLSQLLDAFFDLGNLSLWAAIFAILMITNNLLGFTGVMGYAVYVCTPLLIGWGLWTLIKGFATVPSGDIFSAPTAAPTTTVLIMSLLIIGGLTWGNEPDFFRYSRLRPWYNIPSLLFGYVFGALFFTTAGYLMAELSPVTEFGAMMKYFIEFSLYGLTAFGILIFVVNIVASNDGNLYEAVNALQNIIGWKRWMSVIVLGLVAAFIASRMDSLQDNLFTIAGIGGVFVPSATTIMVLDVFVVPRMSNLRRPVGTVTTWGRTAFANWIGIVALLSALMLGVYTGGLIPHLPRYGEEPIGYPPLQAWALAAALYLVGVYLVRNSPARYKLLGYPIDYEASAVDERVATPQPQGGQHVPA